MRIETVFRENAVHSPDRIAIDAAERTVTYGELDSESDAVMRLLRESGAVPGDVVAVHCESRLAMVVAWLGVLKAECIYSPVDGSQTKERLENHLISVGVAWVLEADQASRNLPCEETFRIRSLPPDVKREEVPTGAPDLDGVAILIFTSGSTARPKGVLVRHQSILKLVQDQIYMPLTQSDRIPQLAHPAFDASSWEVWGPLLNGGTIVLVDMGQMLYPDRFGKEIARKNCSACFLTSAWFHLIAREKPEVLGAFSHCLVGGDIIAPQVVASAFSHCPETRFLHMYGPTEATTFTLWHELNEKDTRRERLPLGQPLTGWEVSLRHGEGIFQGPGEGELVISGVGLTAGYWRNPVLTSERFVVEEGVRYYRTGDRVKRDNSGRLEFQGRLDREIKVRGFRVHLDDLESALKAHSEVAEAVAWKTGEVEDARIVAAISRIKGSALCSGELAAWLAEKVDRVLVPHRIHLLKEVPVLDSGKVDRKAVRRRLDSGNSGVHDVVEADSLVAVWREVLNDPEVDAHTTFAEIGGDSLASVRLVLALEKVCKRKLPVDLLLQADTPAKIGEWLEKGSDISGGPVVFNGNQKRTLIFFHGDVNHGGTFTRAFAEMLPEVRIVTFSNPDILDNAEIKSVEDIVKPLIDEVNQWSEPGPVALAGVCNGGMVAYEMAKELRTRGIPVSFVGLINPPAYPGWLATLARFLGAITGESRVLAGFRSRILFRCHTCILDTGETLEGWDYDELDEISQNAMARRHVLYEDLCHRYRWQPGGISVYGWVDSASSGFIDYFDRTEDDWRAFAKTTRILEGNHRQLDMGSVARELKKLLFPDFKKGIEDSSALECDDEPGNFNG